MLGMLMSCLLIIASYVLYGKNGDISLTEFAILQGLAVAWYIAGKIYNKVTIL